MITCPHCQNDDPRRLEDVTTGPKNPKRPEVRVYLCGNCSKTFKVQV